MRELSLHLLDLVENSVTAGAGRVEVRLEEDIINDRLVMEVIDDGEGMPPELAARAADPFVTSRRTRRVGLGLALLAGAVQQSRGDLAIESSPGRGTRVRAALKLSDIDRMPLGRLEDTLATIALLHPSLALSLVHAGPVGAYSLDLARLAAEVGRPRVRREITRRVQEGRRRIRSVA